MSTGRGSKAHFDHLRKEIKGNLAKMKIVERLGEMSFDGIEKRADELCEEFDKSPTDEIRTELEIIREIMVSYIESDS